MNEKIIADYGNYALLALWLLFALGKKAYKRRKAAKKQDCGPVHQMEPPPIPAQPSTAKKAKTKKRQLSIAPPVEKRPKNKKKIFKSQSIKKSIIINEILNRKIH